VNWRIERVEGADLDVDEVLEVYRNSTLGQRRPIEDRARFTAMLRNANLVVVCRLQDDMIGIARSISDFCYATYLSDIAVSQNHQRSGIGRALIQATQREAPQAKIVLLSAPAATEYYPHIGFNQHGSAWVLNPQ
jgi:predicted N-acetyltransferase YhbS